MSEARRIIHFFSHENVCMHAACSLETDTGARMPRPSIPYTHQQSGCEDVVGPRAGRWTQSASCPQRTLT